MVDKKIVVIGASSEFASAFIKICNYKNIPLLLISRQNINNISQKNSILKINDYLLDIKIIEDEIKQFGGSYIIFFNGVLFENRPVKEPTIREIELTKEVNFTIPYEITKHLVENTKLNLKFVYISSIAAVVERNKNFIYGSCKRNLEISIKNLKLKNYLFLRFGKIFTKMSIDHATPPFSLQPDDAAYILLNKLNLAGIKYPNLKLFMAALILKIIPKKLIEIIGL